MDILGIGPLELVFILIIALIVIGPRDMGKAGRTLGRALNRMYRSDTWRMLTEASRTLRTLPNRLAREANLEELEEVRKTMKKAGQELQGDIKILEEPVQQVDQDLRAWTAPPEPSQPPEEKADPKPGQGESKP